MLKPNAKIKLSVNGGKKTLISLNLSKPVINLYTGHLI